MLSVAWRLLRDPNIGRCKVVAFAYERRIHDLCQSVGKAITIVQRCAMPGPLAELQMSRASRLRLIRRHRLDPDAGRLHEVVKPSLGLFRRNLFQPTQHNRGLHQIGGGHDRLVVGSDASGIIPSILLLTEDGDDGRTVDHDHVGNPWSSYPRISSGLWPVSASAANSPPIFIRLAATRSVRERRRSLARRSRRANVTADVRLSPVSLASSDASLCASSFFMFRCIGFLMVEM